MQPALFWADTWSLYLLNRHAFCFNVTKIVSFRISDTTYLQNFPIVSARSIFSVQFINIDITERHLIYYRIVVVLPMKYGSIGTFLPKYLCMYLPCTLGSICIFSIELLKYALLIEILISVPWNAGIRSAQFIQNC